MISYLIFKKLCIFQIQIDVCSWGNTIYHTK